MDQPTESQTTNPEPSTLDEHFMHEALLEADLAAEKGEVPIGAVVVYQGEIISRAHNTRETDADPAAHAEFIALLDASKKSWTLASHWLYRLCNARALSHVRWSHD